MITKLPLASAFAAAALVVMPMSASAQETPTAPVPAGMAASTTVNAFPAIFGAASAFPAPGNTGFVALSYGNPRGGISGAGGDGDLAVGYTFGSPVTGVSLTAGINVTGLAPFADSGNIFLSLSRALHVGERGATFVGVSGGNLLAWGDAAADDESYSVYVSHLTTVGGAGMELPVQFTFGYGNATTQSADGFAYVGDGFFAGAGVGLTQNLSVGFSATETAFNVGATATVPGVDGLGITAGFYDATNNVERRQFTLSVGYSF